MRRSLLERLRDRRDSLVSLAVLLLLCFFKWRENSPFNAIIIESTQYIPDAYRLWTQFLVMLDQNPIAYVALTSIVFAVVSWSLYLGSREKDRTMMFAWLVFVIYFASVRQAPAYLLLALAILLREYKWSLLLVVPMVLVKEHAGLVYVFYLLAAKKYREAIGVGILWAVTFVSLRLLIGPVGFFVPSDPTLFVSTPIFTLAPYLVRITWMKGLWVAGEIMLCALFLKDRTEVFMVLANLPVIAIFGLFYEPQLWLMVMVAIVYKRKVEENELDTVYDGGVSVLA